MAARTSPHRSTTWPSAAMCFTAASGRARRAIDPQAPTPRGRGAGDVGAAGGPGNAVSPFSFPPLETPFPDSPFQADHAKGGKPQGDTARLLSRQDKRRPTGCRDPSAAWPPMRRRPPLGRARWSGGRAAPAVATAPAAPRAALRAGHFGCVRSRRQPARQRNAVTPLARLRVRAAYAFGSGGCGSNRFQSPAAGGGFGKRLAGGETAPRAQDFQRLENGLRDTSNAWKISPTTRAEGPPAPSPGRGGPSGRPGQRGHARAIQAPCTGLADPRRAPRGGAARPPPTARAVPPVAESPRRSPNKAKEAEECGKNRKQPGVRALTQHRRITRHFAGTVVVSVVNQPFEHSQSLANQGGGGGGSRTPVRR